MINYEYGNLFLENSIDKQLCITDDSGSVKITNKELWQQKFELTETICSEEQLTFGNCAASVVKFTAANIYTSLKGKWINIKMTLDGNEDVPFCLGRYKVDSDKPTADRKKRDYVAYDALYDIINAEIADWYNTLLPNTDSTVTIKQFRDSFFSCCDIEQEEAELINDDMVVAKTIEPEELSGKTVINAICEINACFGYIGRNGKFKYIYLKPIVEGVYPSETLFPNESLYPIEPDTTGISTRNYISANYEDYLVEKITKLQIRQEEDDIGTVIGSGDNTYVIQDNFLVYGKSGDELQTIGKNIFDKISGIYYRPFRAKAKGNPCLELGDAISLSTKYMAVHSYILQRTLTGIQTLRDEYTADGTQYQTAEVNGVQRQIIQLKGKTNVLTRTVEETRLKISDVEKGLYSQISVTAEEIRTELQNTKDGLGSSISQTAQGILSTVSATYETKTDAESSYTSLSSSISQTATSITAEVKRAKNAEEALSASIKINSEKIELKVSEGDVSSVISQESGKISIKSNRLSISSTYFTLTETGKITATEVDLTGKITAKSGEIGGFTITDDEIYNGSKDSLSSTSNGIYLGSDGIACGSKFKVTNAGILTATDVELIGKITANSGEIGGFKITNSSIYSGSKSSLSSTYSGIYIGTDGIAAGTKFKVNTNGEITAKSGTIGGFTIGEDKLNTNSKNSFSSGSGILIDESGIGFGDSKSDFAWMDALGFHTKYSTSGFVTSLRHAASGNAGYSSIRCGSNDVIKFNQNGSKLSGSYVRVGDSGSKLSFFYDTAPTSYGGSTKQTVANISYPSSATTEEVATKLNNLLTALRNYNLIG